jgi:hypothetical protein
LILIVDDAGAVLLSPAGWPLPPQAMVIASAAKIAARVMMERAVGLNMSSS